MPPRTKVEIWFQAEARIGQENGIVREWARRGTRLRQYMRQNWLSNCLFDSYDETIDAACDA
ncbi:hypothetical protein [Mesorhizobium australafricanum]|uniref:hypothetical protein n=1 Tax=Mesorhizobium australafricanum TaxID=3072311 RepID=UPI003D322CD8